MSDLHQDIERMSANVWPPAELDRLRELYADTAADELVAEFGRDIHVIYRMAHKLGLKKSKAFRRRQGQLMAESNAARQHRFQPGLVPWNKGTHWAAGGRSVETRFKAGRAAHEALNYLPIGSVRMHKADYLEKKVSDDLTVYPAKRWKAVHRIVWEAAHGPIPAGFICAFKPGMKTFVEAEITLDRLELITRAENMQRNSFHTTLAPEVAKLVQLRAVVTRRINKIAKETSHVE